MEPVTTFEVRWPGDDRLGPDPSLDATRASLRAATLHGAGQDEVRQHLVAFVDGHPDALERTCRPGHLTGSALVVDPDTGAVLVLFHRKLQRWLQPGGHADGDADLAHVAWREATEETGIDGLGVVVPAIHLDIHEVRPPAEDPHLHLDVRYLVLAPPGAKPVGNHESEGLRWVAVSELAALGADDGLLALAARGLEVLADLGDVTASCP